ncbi:MAG: hypothetical protein PHF21_02585 [Bacilli bacterium]|nr:hypothetical protein [Bacilli bacterium]
MKKYLYCLFILLIILILQFSYKSYGHEYDCSNVIDNPSNLNSLNLEEYIEKKYFTADVNYFCSYNKCYYIRNENLNSAISNYLTLQDQKGMSEYVIESRVKGFPITKISFNLCR